MASASESSDEFFDAEDDHHSSSNNPSSGSGKWVIEDDEKYTKTKTYELQCEQKSILDWILESLMFGAQELISKLD